MTEQDFIEFGVKLCELWPDRYKGEDLRHWRKRLDTYPIKFCKEALVQWKNSSRGRFPPSTDEVEEIVRANMPPTPPGISAYDRTQSYRAEQERNAERVETERGSIDAEFERLAADSTPDEMAALCQVAAARYAGSEFGRRLLARGPAGSKFLRQLVIEHVNKGKSVGNNLLGSP
jgi:hypothetical protein